MRRRSRFALPLPPTWAAVPWTGRAGLAAILLSVPACGGDDSVSAPVGPPAPGTIAATVATIGTDLDTDGYTVSLSVGGQHAVPIAGTVTISGVQPGDYLVALEGVSANCSVAGQNPRTVTVLEGAAASTRFEVTCSRADLMAFTSPRLGGQNVWLMSPDGSNPRRVAQAGLDIDLAWAPDGSHFAYVSQRGPQDHLTIARWDGSGTTSIFVGSPVRSPDWSPDGSRLAFLASTDLGPADIWVVQADGTGAVNLTNDEDPGAYAWVRWSPDGSRLVFESTRSGSQGRDIWALAPDGTGLTNLTDAPGTDRWARWSPSGDRIAYVRAVEPHELWVMGADGNDPTLVTAPVGPAAPASAAAPAWSPDGARIAFVADGDLWVVGVDGAGRINLTDGRALVLDAELAWSHDGSRIAFVVTRDGGVGADIWIISPDGSGLLQLTDEPGLDLSPRWRP